MFVLFACLFAYVFIIIAVKEYYGDDILEGGGGAYGTIIILEIVKPLSCLNVVFCFW